MFSKSLLSFFNDVVLLRLGGGQKTILDIGCGSYSIFEETKIKAEISAIDISEELIKKTPLSNIQYAQVNVVNDSQFFKDSLYDLVFDSHCFNCLTKEDDRNHAYKNIFFSLKSGGIFASEMMIQPTQQEVHMPYKWVKPAFEIEKEIIQQGFEIKYFMILRDSVFYNYVDGVEINCDLVRIVAIKPS